MIPIRFDEQSILVLGLGVSGLAVAEAALRRGATVQVLDEQETSSLREQAERLRNRGAKVCLDWTGSSWDKKVDLVVISPGIAPDSAMGRLAEQLDAPVISELEFGFYFCACPILAITGTNGKTTTVELTVHALKAAGLKALGAGNLGVPLCEAARQSAQLDFMVVECSSFQLERIQQFAPYAAALLNFSDDHLDRYSGRDAYLSAKLNLFRHVHPQFAVLRADLAERKEIRDLPLFADGAPTTFSADPEIMADYGMNAACGILHREPNKTTELGRVDGLKFRGRHNWENVLACLALCRMVGVSTETVLSSLTSFAPGAHRQELVAVTRGIRFINDSKATNPDAVIRSLLTFGEEKEKGKSILLIAGGRTKGLDFSSVCPYIRRFVKEVYLIGEARDQLAEIWTPEAPCMKFSSLSAVVDAILDSVQPGETVLLAPGCASHDMFSDYAERGNIFTKELKRRLEE